MRPATITIGRKKYKGYIQESRLSAETITAFKSVGYHIHNIRHSDSNPDNIATLERSVCVNFFGVFVHNYCQLDEIFDSVPFLYIKDWEYTD